MAIQIRPRGFWGTLRATALLTGLILVAVGLVTGNDSPSSQHQFQRSDDPGANIPVANTLVATAQVSTPQAPDGSVESPSNQAAQSDEDGPKNQTATGDEDGSRSAPEASDSAVWIGQLSDSQLTKVAQTGELPAGLTAPPTLSSERLHELLVRELVRRLENQAAKEGQQDSGRMPQPAPASADSETAASPDSETAASSDSASTLRDKPGNLEPGSSAGAGQLDAVKALELREVIVERSVAEAVLGEPMGVGRMEVEFKAGHGPILRPDQLLFLRSTEWRSNYATFEVEYQPADDRTKHQVQRIRSLFLVAGRGPIELKLCSSQGELVREKLFEIVDDRALQMRLRGEWWQAFSKISPELSQEQRQLKVVLLDLLARRHRFSLSRQQRSIRAKEDRESLETQFEHAVEMLFGIESVKLAMQGDVTLRDSTQPESADRPVPTVPRMNSIAVPNFKPVPIEPIAMRVPAECFYVRTGNIANYMYFRKFLTDWGGSLDDIVSRGHLDHRVRERLEFQLAIDSATIDREQLDASISDMAIIGCDPLFDDGAAVGVVFEASDGLALTNQIMKQRRQMMKSHPDVDERQVRMTQHAVSFLTTEDHRVRSFYAIDGRYHLVTNSESILKRFFEAGQGDRALGQLREFGYARSKPNTTGDVLTFLYLSDPFFQNLVSPHYRIEMTRRAVAAREAQQLQLARLVARAEQVQAETVNDLIRASLLPKFFGVRPDNSRATYQNRRYQDTIRGVPGSFLPVPDVTVEKATSTEVSAYRQFVGQYNRQWGRIDPVTVVFSKQSDFEDKNLHEIGLEILVTPYAKSRYALLNRYLAEPSRQQFTRNEKDLLSVQAAVRSNRLNAAHLLTTGLRDDAVPFEIQQGKVQLLGEDDDATFAKSRGYLAITPPSLDVLRTLASVLLKGQARPLVSSGSVVQPRQPAQPRQRVVEPPMILPPNVPIAGQVLYYFGWAFRNMPAGTIGASKYISMIEERDGLMVVSETEGLRDRIFAGIEQERVQHPSKIRLKMSALQGTQVEPYIQAFTYLDSRRVSAQNSRLLNEWTDWLRLPAEYSRGTVENLLNARILCPLGGDYASDDLEGRVHWSGTAWGNSSVCEVTRIPDDWQFPFLHWLRGLDLHFDLDQDTLHAQVELKVRMNLSQTHQEALVDLNTLEVGRLLGNVRDEPFPESIFASTDDVLSNAWVLGVRVPREGRVMTVSAVHANSPAAHAGIRVGDVIERINGEVPTSSADLIRLIGRTSQSGKLDVSLRRQGRQQEMLVPLTR